METERSFEKLDDEELAAEAKKGDREARNALYFRCRERIAKITAYAKHEIAKAWQGDPSLEPEDISQQAFLAFCELLEDWEPTKAPFARYLNTLQWRLSHYVRGYTHSRSRGLVPLPRNRRKAKEWTQPDEVELASAPTGELESRAAWLERTESLNDKWKQAINLRFQEGLTSGEIAALSGRSRRSVNRDLSAALAELRQEIEDEWEGCG